MVDDSASDGADGTLALIFELENFAVAGRETLFEAISKAVSTKKTSMEVPQYSRFCVDRTIHQGVTDFLTHTNGSDGADDAVTEAAQKQSEALILKAAKSPKPELDSVLSHFAKKGVVFGAVSTLPEDIANGLSEAVDCESRGILVGSSGSPRGRRLSTESWRKLARTLNVRPYNCIAICTSAAACRSAIAANMVCVALPDRFTEFQDFGGANVILDTVDVKVLGKLFDAMND